jgi:hypothetical protein
VTIARVQHIYVGKSLLPRDQYVTTFHFVGNNPLNVAAAETLRNVVERFYTLATGQTKALLHYHSFPAFAPYHTRYKVYNMSQPKPRVPILDGPHPTLSAVNAAPALPAEVAVCLSYNAAPAAGKLARRNRGRIYLGPLNTNALQQAGDGHARPEPMILSDVKIAAKRLANEAFVDGGWFWCGYSPTSIVDPEPGDEGNIDPGAFIVTSCSTDDAFDTQRRRGIGPTARTALAVP